jgi:hypothetical protein
VFSYNLVLETKIAVLIKLTVLLKVDNVRTGLMWKWKVNGRGFNCSV